MINRFLIAICSLLSIVFAQIPCVAIAQDITSLGITGSEAEIAPVALTLQDLDELDQITFTTSTIWTDAEVTFSGVSLKALLEGLNIAGPAIELIALNDYSITIPMDELDTPLPIIATRMDGEQMSVRDKGPFWLVYDYDSDEKFQNETIYSRSIWQLNRIKIVEQ